MHYGEGDSFYDSVEWFEIKNAVTLRDGPLCQICGSLDRVTAHHIVPRRFKDDVKYDIDQLSNLINICWDCHEKADRKFTQLTPYDPDIDYSYPDGEKQCYICGNYHPAQYRVCFECHEQGRG